MKQILTKSLFFGSEESGFGLLFIEKLVCFWSVFSKFWSVLIIGDTVLDPLRESVPFSSLSLNMSTRYPEDGSVLPKMTSVSL